MKDEKKKRDFSDTNPPIGVSALWILMIVNPHQLSLSLHPAPPSIKGIYSHFRLFSTRTPSPESESHTRDLLKTGNKNGRRPHEHPQLILFLRMAGFLSLFYCAPSIFFSTYSLESMCSVSFPSSLFFKCVSACVTSVVKSIKQKQKKLR